LQHGCCVATWLAALQRDAALQRGALRCGTPE
jgi:hypothetical protein